MKKLRLREAAGLWIAIGVLAYFTAILLRPLWESIAWSIILAIVTWPVYRRIGRVFGIYRLAGAIVMGLLVMTALLVPLWVVLSAVSREIKPAYEMVKSFLAVAPPPPRWSSQIPGVVEIWEEGFRIAQGNTEFDRQWLKPLLQPGARAVAFLGGSLVHASLAIFTLFFFYYFGDSYIAQAKLAMRHVTGDRFERLLVPTKEALRSVFAGVMLAAVAQGLVAGLGYAFVGLKAPILLGFGTGILALVPFGAVLAWGTATIGLFMSGVIWKAVFMLAWGVLVVSWVDNLVRPLVISGTARLPYLQTFFSLIGGVAAFGLIGLFIGPTILAVWMVIWQEWVEAGKSAITDDSSQNIPLISQISGSAPVQPPAL